VRDITMNLRFAGLVKRYHTWPVLREQTVAEHTWHVLRIYDKLFGLPSVEVVRAIMYHDVGEVRTGDAPFPAKRDNPDLKKAYDRVESEHRLKLLGADPELAVSENDLRKLKICDLVEMWEFGMEEYLKGNNLAIPIIDRTKQFALGLCDSPLEDMNLIRHFTETFSK
jgi:5'-deoxynucleotidase YfbR-like HD superfamily hydrolase